MKACVDNLGGGDGGDDPGALFPRYGTVVEHRVLRVKTLSKYG